MNDIAADLTRSLDAENPWPGLMPFTEATQAFFHGRDEEAAELLRRVRRERLTILFGQSGLGKSSLLCAGLFPRLRAADFLPAYIRLDWTTSQISPIGQIKQALADNLVGHGVEGRASRPDETLWGYFHEKETEFWSRRNRLITPVLVFDQFEEIFTLGRGAASAETVEELAALIENRPPESLRSVLDNDPEVATRYDFAKESCKVILALREDFLPDLEGLRRRMPSIMANRMRLTRMNGRQARDAVLASGGHLMVPGVGEKVIAFVSATHGRAEEAAVGEQELATLEIEPALLSIVCSELNNKRIRLGRAQITEDLLEGAQEEIVGHFYEMSLAQIDPALELFIEEQLLTAEGYRDTRPLAEALHEPGVTRADIDKLVLRRLLRIEDRFGTQWVELTHDLLTDVIRQRRDLRREQTEAEARVQAERERAERAEAEATRERSEREAQATLAREAAEREGVAQRLVRRTRVFLGATMFALVLATGALAYAWHQQHIANLRTAEAEQQRKLAEEHSEEAMRIQLIIIHGFASSSADSADNKYKELVEGLRAYQSSLERRAAESPGDTGRRKELAIIHYWIYLGLESSKDRVGALAELKEFQSATEQLALPDIEDYLLQRDLALIHSTTAGLLESDYDLAGALSEVRAALAILHQLADKEPGEKLNQLFLYSAHATAGNILEKLGDTAGALSEFKMDRTISEQFLTRNSEDSYWLEQAAQSRLNIASALETQGDLAGALEQYRATHDFYEQRAAKDPDKVVARIMAPLTQSYISHVLHSQGDYAGALSESRAAMAGVGPLVATFGGLKPSLAAIHWRMCEALREQGDLAAAVNECSEALRIDHELAAKADVKPEIQVHLAVSHDKLGKVLMATGNPGSAAEEFRTAAAIIMPLVTRNPQMAEWQQNLSELHKDYGDAERELDAYGRAREEYAVCLTSADQILARWSTNKELTKTAEYCRAQLAAIDERPQNAPK
jgi:tetratricopeptide (TPR) repeat protein